MAWGTHFVSWFRELGGGGLGTVTAEGVQVDDEGDGGAGEGAEGAAMGNFRAGGLVEREKVDDVRGDADGVEAVVDADGGVTSEGEERDEGCQGVVGKVEVSGDERGQIGSGEGAEDAEEGAGEGFEEGGLLDDEGGHGDPVAGLDGEAAVELRGKQDGEDEAQSVDGGSAAVGCGEGGFKRGGEVAELAEQAVAAAEERREAEAEIWEEVKGEGGEQELNHGAGEDEAGAGEGKAWTRRESRGDEEVDAGLLADPGEAGIADDENSVDGGGEGRGDEEGGVGCGRRECRLGLRRAVAKAAREHGQSAGSADALCGSEADEESNRRPR